MKNPIVRMISKWMFRGYMVWSVCADLALVGGIFYINVVEHPLEILYNLLDFFSMGAN